MFARLENNIVVERLDLETLPDFHPDLVWVACGAEVKEGWVFNAATDTFTDPQDLVTIEDLKVILKTKVTALREQKIQDGFSYAGRVFQIGIDAQKDMLSMQTQFILENDLAYDGFWMDAQNQPKIMTKAQAQDFFQHSFTFVKGLKGAAWTHKAAIEALQSKDDCNSYDFTIGWP